MKFYTPALVNAKKKRSFWTIFVGQASDQRHYRARHRTEDITIMWLEASQFGKINAFPCVLREGEEYMVFYTAKTPQTSKDNADFVKRWNLFATPQNIQTEWDVEEMDKKEFYSLFHEIQHNVLEKEINRQEGKAPVQLESENQEPVLEATAQILEPEEDLEPTAEEKVEQ